MSTEMVVVLDPATLIAIVIQQLFIIYALYALFIQPMFKKSIRDKLLNTIRDSYTRGEIDTEAYRNLENDIMNLDS